MAKTASPLHAWVALNLIPELTGAAWRRLSARFGSPGRILEQPLPALEGVVGTAIAQAIVRGPDPSSLRAAIAWCGEDHHAILTPDDERYPALLLETASAPPVLYAWGRLDLLRRPALAIVGSRNASAQGQRNAGVFARAASTAGICVVSGLAAGIDAAAHQAALEASGSTIAVLGNGVDVVYPRQHASLLDRIRREGLALSEFPLGTAPIAKHFPRRNRIISALAQGCLVVEAAMASGSLITARLAVEMGRDVFAIPGSIHSPLSRGCHYLIKQGAKLVEEPSEVLEEFGVSIAANPRAESSAPPLPGGALQVLNALGYDACDVDTLIERTAMNIEDVLATLTQLELDGLLERLADGRYQRVK